MAQDSANPAYAQLFELSPFPAVVSRLDDYRVLAVNRSAVDVVGVRPADAIGHPVSGYYVDPAQRLELIDVSGAMAGLDNVRLHIKRANGAPFWVMASIRVIDWNGEPAALTVFHDISDQLAAESSLKASERRLAAQSDALTDLTRAIRPRRTLRRTPAGDPGALRPRLAGGTVEPVEVHGSPIGDSLRRTVRATPGQHESGAVLQRREAPDIYFDAIERERVVEAHDAQNDPRTCGFTAGYLIPHGIGAMLDAACRDNVAVGVLCAEHVGGLRSWTIDEQNFAIAVSNLIVVAIVEEERRGSGPAGRERGARTPHRGHRA